MTQASDDIILIQSGTSEIKAFRATGGNEVLEVVAKQAPAVSERLRAAMGRIKSVRDEVVKDPDKVVKYVELQAAQARADRFVNDELEQITAGEHAGKIDEYHRYTSVGSCLLYTHINYEGSSKFLTTTWPNLSWWPYRFNDRASSARAWGGNVLFQHSWYSGRKLWLIGIPFIEIPDFTVFDFNDRASSYAGFGL